MAIKAHPVTKNGKAQWYCVLPKKLTGKRERIFRPTKAAAERAAVEAMEERGAFGHEMSGLSVQERALILRFRGKLGAEELESALTQAVEMKQRGAKIEDAVAGYLSRLEGKVSQSHLIDVRYRLRNLAKYFPGRVVAGIRPVELSDFFSGKGASAPNFYRIVRAFYSDLVFRDVVGVNPFDRLPAPAMPVDREDRFEIYTPEEMARFLTTAVEIGEVEVARDAVLTGFYGLRESEAQRLDIKNIDARGVIFVERMKTRKKGMRERYVEPEPNGWAWLQFLGLPLQGNAVGFAVKAMTRRRNLVLKAAKLQWPYNGRRRAYGSYHLAAYENAAVTAEKMGHTDAETTKGKYRVARRKEEALAYFGIVPSG